MVNLTNLTIANAFLGGTTTAATSGVDASLLTAWAQAKAGIGVDVKTASADPNAPLAPVWTPGVSPSAEALIRRALDNKAFFDPSAKLYSDLGATGDYKRLFALYSGLTMLQALAGRMEDDKLSGAQKTQTLAQFTRGMSEIETFFAQNQFEDIRLAQGDRVDVAQTTLAMPARSEDYLTGIVHKGGVYAPVSGLDPNAVFNIVATSANGTVRDIAINLAEMGTQSRSLGAVIGFINTKLAAAGAASRLEAVDLTPKTTTLMLGGKPITTRYAGLKQYAIKVDVRAGERVAFEAAAAEPAFYVAGANSAGARLIKLEDVSGEPGQPVWLSRPDATADPIGTLIGAGWYGAGPPYTSAPAGSFEQRSNALLSSGESGTETALRTAGEAVLKLDIGQGRILTVTTGWRTGDQEAWRVRDGENEDRALMDDLAERLTQVLHEQGVAAGVDVWEDVDGNVGLSVFSGDLIRASSLSIGEKSVRFEAIDPPGMVGGLRDGVFARRFSAGGVAAPDEMFVGEQTFVITTAMATQTVTIDGGEDGIDAGALAAQLNEKLRALALPAAASLVDEGGALSFRLDALHDVVAASATLNQASHELALQAPDGWANGGLPNATAGQIFGDAVRSYAAAESPLLDHAGALDIEIVVATPAGQRTVSVSVSAQERLDHPDAAPGQWNALLQARLDEALNAAGVYVSAASGDLAQFAAAEGAGHRLVSVSVNGAPLALEADAPALGLGGAFAVERSFTSAEAANGVADDVGALLDDPNVSMTFGTVWGERTVGVQLQPGDPRTLESAALRLNEALAAQGYDLGVAAVALAGGGAGLRVVAGSSHTVRTVTALTFGAEAHAPRLDPIDVASHADDPPGALRVAARAARGASASEAIPSASTFTAPSAAASGWFAGRAFDIAVGGSAKVAAARAVAAGADGSVYVLADFDGQSASSAMKGARDIALMKYDSAGKLLFTQMLGAAQSASGFALAVSDDGKVAVAGAVEGALSGASGAKGGLDSLVVMFDADGKELWTARRGAAGDDQINAIAFAPDGSLIVAGQTSAAFGGAAALGGQDAYVRGYSAGGGELFTGQFGTSGTDAATALLVRDDGAGGVEIVTGGVEDQRGVLRRFVYSTSAGIVQTATRDIGYFYKGAINAIAADGAALYVGGEVGADRLNVGESARASAAGQEGFVARLDADLSSLALDRTSYLGSAQDDAVRALAVVGGVVYAAGAAGGVLAGQGGAKSSASFLARLNEAGDVAWARTFNSAGGRIALSGLAVDASGASALDVLGLPRGEATATTATPLVDRSALRAGDHFRIGADGRRLTTITIGANDTMATLVASINRAIAGAGRAKIVREDGAERIEIAAQDGKAVRIASGRAERNALGALGLVDGVVSASAAGRGALKTYGLGLIAADLKLDSPANIARAKAEISAAISIVRQAYEGLVNPFAEEMTEAERALEARRKNAGPAPEYYSAKLANYLAALSRLSGL